MSFYTDLLRLLGFPNAQQIEFYNNRAKRHTAVRNDEQSLALLASDVAECYEGRNENSNYCKKLKGDYDALYAKHYGKTTPESNIAMMYKYSARVDLHREAWASTQRLFNSEKKNDEGRMWNLADSLFDCHASHHAGSAECRKMKEQYDELYRKHYG